MGVPHHTIHSLSYVLLLNTNMHIRKSVNKLQLSSRTDEQIKNHNYVFLLTDTSKLERTY